MRLSEQEIEAMRRAGARPWWRVLGDVFLPPLAGEVDESNPLFSALLNLCEVGTYAHNEARRS